MSTDTLLWKPSAAFKENANLTNYHHWLQKHRDLSFEDYASLWKWSVENPADFWESLADYFEVDFHVPPTEIMSNDPMPHTQWFKGSQLNYAEHIFKQKSPHRPAILFASEDEETRSIPWEELEQKTASLRAFLKKSGVKKGDRVVAYLPNIPEATISFLAVNSLGAVWSSCSPDFGSGSVLDRFKQIEPNVLIVVDGYRYNGKPYDRQEVIQEISRQLPSVKKVIGIPYLDKTCTFEKIENLSLWEEAVQDTAAKMEFTSVDFSHPIWVLYSSGTTGKPKAITHSHGGMLLEHLKYLSFHNDVKPGENFFWFSTTGWMMWNFVQASLLVGATIVLYDGSAGYPNLEHLWKLAEELPIHHFGTSAPFIIALMKKGIKPGEAYDLSQLRSIGSTGAPLPPAGFDYVYEHISPTVWLCSMSGGTDICTALVGGNPWKPVIEGEIQSRALGCALYAFDDAGKAVTDKVGEMVITKPMPCMPIYFWNDEGFARYKASYFEVFPGKWRHGDWVKITKNDGVIILGRSDTTLNRQGIRIGTAEVYRAVNKVTSVKDSLIVNIELPKGGDYMPLFVVMQEGETYSEAVKKEINAQIRKACSPRHVPDEIIAVKDIPYTISGKKMEAPVKKILMGVSPDKAANKGAMRNPEALDFYVDFAKTHLPQ